MTASLGAPELVAVLIALGAVVTVIQWVLRPLLRGPVPLDAPDPLAVALLSRREAALAGLRDLEADHANGRISEDDFQALRAELVAEGAATLAALDRLATSAAGRSEALTARVEADVDAVQAGRNSPRSRS